LQTESSWYARATELELVGKRGVLARRLRGGIDVY
jgi:hypothetical protein